MLSASMEDLFAHNSRQDYDNSDEIAASDSGDSSDSEDFSDSNDSDETPFLKWKRNNDSEITADLLIKKLI